MRYMVHQILKNSTANSKLVTTKPKKGINKSVFEYAKFLIKKK